MNKRKNNTNITSSNKKYHTDNYVCIKKIIVRNDHDLYVYTECPLSYIKIGDNIFKTKKLSEYYGDIYNNIDNIIALNVTQYKMLFQYIFDKNKILISNYPHSLVSVTTININIHGSLDDKSNVNEDQIIKYIHEKLNGHFMFKNHEFYLYYGQYKLTIQIKYIEDNINGIVDDDTQIIISNIGNDIVIYNDVHYIPYSDAKIIIKKCTKLSNNNSKELVKLPLIISNAKISEYVKDAFLSAFTNDTNMLYTKNGYEYTFNITVSTIYSSIYRDMYVFINDDTNIEIDSITSDLYIYNKSFVASKIGLTVKKLPATFYSSENYIIHYQTIHDYIKKHIKSFVKIQKIIVPIGKKNVLLSIDYINPHSDDNILYKINSDTIISFNKKSKFIIVDNIDPIEINKITFDIKNTDDSKCIFNQTKLLNVIKQVFPKKTALNHEKEITFKNNKYVVSVEHIEFKNNINDTNKYPLYGFFTNDTIINITTIDKNLVIDSCNINDIPKDPIGELEKYVGGISNELKTVTRTICLSRGKLKKEFHERGLKPAKGIVLYGPPGTGKCLHPDTPIIMFDGSIKKANQINVYDQLMGDDSYPRNGLSVCNGYEEMFTIVQSNGDNYIVNKSHILSLISSNNVIIDVPLESILINKEYYLTTYYGFKVGTKFSYSNINEDPYLIGELCVKNNMIPFNYIYNTSDIRLQLLAGIIDTCGYVHNNSYIIHIDSYYFANDIIFLCRSLCFETNYEINKIILQGSLNVIPSKIYSICDSFNNSSSQFIKYRIDIKFIGLGNYCGFEIDGNKRFLLGDFTVTHNTTLARNLGRILNCTGEQFKLISGPEIFNKWVGESEANVRKLFKPAKSAWKKKGLDAPLYMIVIDEIDAIIPTRGQSEGNSVRDTVVNQFLSELDGLEKYENLLCIGTTNRLELLDSAAIRPGRLGLHIKIDVPNADGRIKIFQIHTKKLFENNRIDPNISFKYLADLTNNFNGADIENVVQLASTFSLERLNKLDNIDISSIQQFGCVTINDFTNAIKELTPVINKSDSTYLNMFI